MCLTPPFELDCHISSRSGHHLPPLALWCHQAQEGSNGASSHETEYVSQVSGTQNIKKFKIAWLVKKNYSGFAEWVDFAFWSSCIGNGPASYTVGLFKVIRFIFFGKVHDFCYLMRSAFQLQCLICLWSSNFQFQKINLIFVGHFLRPCFRPTWLKSGGSAIKELWREIAFA